MNALVRTKHKEIPSESHYIPGMPSLSYHAYGQSVSITIILAYDLMKIHLIAQTCSTKLCSVFTQVIACTILKYREIVDKDSEHTIYSIQITWLEL